MYSAIGTTGLKRTAADHSQHPMLSGPPQTALCAMFRELFRSRRRPQPCRAGGRRGGAGGGADVCARCVVLPAAAGGAADPRSAAAGGAGRPGARRMGHRRPSPGGEFTVMCDSCNHQWAGVAQFKIRDRLHALFASPSMNRQRGRPGAILVCRSASVQPNPPPPNCAWKPSSCLYRRAGVVG